MPFTFTIAKSVTKTVVATPADADEGPGALAGGNVPTWEAVDPTHLSVVQAADGLSAQVTPLRANATSLVRVTAQPSAGGTIIDSFAVVTPPNPATHFNFAVL